MHHREAAENAELAYRHAERTAKALEKELIALAVHRQQHPHHVRGGAVMNRNVPLQRRTPLQARKPLTASTPMRRGNPLPQVSKKRARQIRERRTMLQAKYPGIIAVRSPVPATAWPTTRMSR